MPPPQHCAPAGAQWPSGQSVGFAFGQKLPLAVQLAPSGAQTPLGQQTPLPGQQRPPPQLVEPKPQGFCPERQAFGLEPQPPPAQQTCVLEVWVGAQK